MTTRPRFRASFSRVRPGGAPFAYSEIKVQEFPSSQLGNELQQQAALQGGVQEMLVASTTSLNGIV